jgi:ABC-type sugar transport system substrate-binding protein
MALGRNRRTRVARAGLLVASLGAGWHAGVGVRRTGPAIRARSSVAARPVEYLPDGTYHAGQDLDSERSLIEDLVARRIDGIIAVPAGADQRHLAAAAEGVPVVVAR